MPTALRPEQQLWKSQKLLPAISEIRRRWSKESGCKRWTTGPSIDLFGVPHGIMVGQMHEFVNQVRLVEIASNGAEFFVS